MTPAEIQLWLQLGIGGVVTAALLLGARGAWYYGSVYREALAQRDVQYVEMVADRDLWRNMALRLLPVAEKATSVAEVTVRNGSHP